MGVLQKPQTMEEVVKVKKSAKMTFISCAVLFALLILATAMGISSRVLILFVGILLGLGIVQWYQANKAEKELSTKVSVVPPANEPPQEPPPLV